MSRSPRNVSVERHNQLVEAWALARRARDKLREAGAMRAHAYTARALKSIEGALRHSQRVLGQRGLR